MLHWILFESFVALAILSGLTLFGLLVHWRRSLNPRPLLIGLAVTLLLFLIQTLVVTPREHLHALMRPVEQGVEEGDVAAVIGPFVQEFVAGDMSREQFADWVGGQLRRIDVEGVRRLRSVAEADGSNAWRGEVAYSGMVSTADLRGQLVTCSWRIWFRRDGERYVITRIEPLRVNGQNVSSWHTFEQF